jgi:hypothetical protein
MRLSRILSRVALLAVAVTLAPSALAQYTITSSVIAGGGATFSTGGTYSLGGTIGQPDASNAMIGGTYSLTGGFWARIAVFLKGDATGNGIVDVADVFYLINNLFAGGPPAPSPCVADVDSSTAVNVSDIFFLINYLFAGGPAPAPPNC